ncbi:MAG: ATP-binding cassette domain-containing protein [Eubacteriales bacterium]
MKQQTASRVFSPMLRRISLAAWVLRLFPIPFGLLTARFSAALVSAAVDGQTAAVVQSGLALLALIVGLRLFDGFTGIAYDRASSAALHRCKMELYRRFLGCPLHVLYATEHGKAVESLNEEFSTVTGKSTNLYPGFFTGLLTAAVYFVDLLRQSVPCALVLLAFSLVQMAPPFLVRRYMQQNYDDYQDIEAEYTDRTLEIYYGFTEIKMYGLKQWWLGRMAAFQKKYLRVCSRAEITGRIEDSMDAFVENLLKYGTYGVLGAFVLTGVTPLDTAVAAIALSGGLFGAVKGIFAAVPDFAVAKTAEERMSAWFRESGAETRPLPENVLPLALDHVSLSYGDGAVLRDVSARIDAGGVVLLHGANGAGKSTLLRLFTGLLRADMGQVTVGGIPPESLRFLSADGVFYLPQEDASFGFSAAELYRMALPPENAARAADGARGFGLTDGQLGQPINTLSGGERKKVFLSLGLASDAQLLLLDEPTNSLDDASRRLLCRRLTERGGAVVVSHDRIFDTVPADRYLITNGGIIHER